MSTIDILIAAAHESELLGLGFRSSNVQGLRVETRALGVGMPAAAVGAMRALSDTRPSALILLGSCGVYRARSPAEILTPVVPDTLRLIDAGVVAAESAFPDVMPVGAEASEPLAAGLASAIPSSMRGALATTLGITTSDALAERLAAGSGCAFENLEALGVALASRSCGVPFAGLLVVTNEVGSRGREQWRANFRAAADSGGEALLGWLRAGAPGLPR